MDAMSLLLVKLTLAPALVVGSSLAGRRWGPEASGLLVALPLVAGPILLIVDLDHGAHFASRAAAGSSPWPPAGWRSSPSRSASRPPRCPPEWGWRSRSRPMRSPRG